MSYTRNTVARLARVSSATVSRVYNHPERVDEATAIVREGLAVHPDDPSLLYNAACYESLSGRLPDALAHLSRAFGAG